MPRYQRPIRVEARRVRRRSLEPSGSSGASNWNSLGRVRRRVDKMTAVDDLRVQSEAHPFNPRPGTKRPYRMLGTTARYRFTSRHVTAGGRVEARSTLLKYQVRRSPLGLRSGTRRRFEPNSSPSATLSAHRIEFSSDLCIYSDSALAAALARRFAPRWAIQSVLLIKGASVGFRGLSRNLVPDRSIAGFGPIVLKKSFWGDERKVSEPLTRLTRVDVRDHIVSP
jgi:hypothetical protein